MSAKAFVERFYANWLQQGEERSDRAAALEATRAYCIEYDPHFN